MGDDAGKYAGRVGWTVADLRRALEDMPDDTPVFFDDCEAGPLCVERATLASVVWSPNGRANYWTTDAVHQVKPGAIFAVDAVVLS